MPAKRPPNSAKPSEAPARILAVDDDENVLLTYRRLLTKAGYQVQTASSGEEALGLLQKQSYDLILLDLNMPGMNGMEFMKRWRRLRSRPEVLVVSGYATTENTVEVVKLGASDVVQKPCQSSDLLPRVERILARRTEPVVAYIRANFATIRSREEMARRFSTTVRAISRRVMHYTDQSFHDFLESCRIQEAQRLLEETELEVKQIFTEVGFRSFQVFDRAFRQQTGCTPHQYRQEIHIDQEKN